MSSKKREKKDSLQGIDKKVLKKFAHAAKKSKTVTTFKVR